MPRIPRTVHWAESEGVRDPLPDERAVLKDFTKHMERCSTCRASLKAGSGPFCSYGYGYFQDMSPYFYLSKGRAYSSLDRDRNLRNQVRIPEEFELASLFFSHVSKGFDPRSSSRVKPVVIPEQRTTTRPRSRDFDKGVPIINPSSKDKRRTDREKYYEEKRSITRRPVSYYEQPIVYDRSPTRSHEPIYYR